MYTSHSDFPIRRAAILTGIGFLVSFLGALFSGMYVNELIDPGDPASTARNIAESPILFRAGIFSWMLVILGDLIRAWALWVFFRPVNQSLALLAAWCMLLHDAIFGSSIVHLFSAAELASGAEYLSSLGSDQVSARLMLSLKGFDSGFQLGLFFFSFHLGILGYLVYKSVIVPKYLGILLYIAAFGYLIDSITKIMIPEPPAFIWMIFMLPCLIGELALVLWLTIKGGRT